MVNEMNAANNTDELFHITDEQVEAAIEAYDAAWNPNNRGHDNKFNAIKEAILASRRAAKGIDQ